MPIHQLKERDSRSYGTVQEQAEFRLKKIRGNQWTWRGIFRNLVKLAVVGLVLFALLVVWASRDMPDPNKLSSREVNQSTKIYDRTGEHLLYEVYQNQKRTVLTQDQIAPWAYKAVVAIEDKHFYEHSGIRFISIARAIFNDVIGRSQGGGGASTITQQLIKNAMIGDNKAFLAKIQRKIKELILAPQLEKKYTKDQILTMYLNEIPYGSTNYGIESASQTYFHKTAKDISLAEAATLAAMIQAPSRYLNDQVTLTKRRDLVLRYMLEQGYINQTEKDEAVKIPLKIFRGTGILDAPHFVLYVKQLLADQFGESSVDTGGLKVLTTLDYDLQQSAQKIVKENGDKFAKEANANNASLVSIDPKTGQILAMVGSRDFENEEIDGQYNVAVLGKRQPGSSFKPFIYTAAFEKGYTPETVLYDVNTNFETRSDGTKYAPKNYDGKEHGLVTMRKSLQGSLNIPAVKTMYLVGVKEAEEFARRFGYTTFDGSDYGLTMVLGGAEVNLLEHTNAYATLADNGSYHAPSSILKVENNKGEKLFEWQEPEKSEAITPELAALISNVLSDDPARAYIFGSRSTLTLPDRPVAAKTGTTNDSKDAWTLGYTPSIATGVWVGNTTPSPMKGGGQKLAGTIFNQFMREATKGKPVENFPEIQPNNAEKPVLRGADNGIKLPINRLTGKIASSSTPPNLTEERIYLPPHDILFYVNRNDPRGATPENPASDPQYDAWETGLQDWVRRENEAGRPVSLEEPPNVYDTPQSSEFSPTLDIISPAPEQNFSTRNLNFEVRASAPRGISQVLYYLDGTIIGQAYAFPFSLSYFAKTLPAGNHTLRVMAQDDLGNTTIKEVQFNLTAPAEPPSFSWGETGPAVVSTKEFPRAFLLAPYRWEDIKEIKIYLRSAIDEKLIYTFNHTDQLQNNNLFLIWKRNPGVGYYTLRALMIDNQGRTEEHEIEVEVR